VELSGIVGNNGLHFSSSIGRPGAVLLVVYSLSLVLVILKEYFMFETLPIAYISIRNGDNHLDFDFDGYMHLSYCHVLSKA